MQNYDDPNSISSATNRIPKEWFLWGFRVLGSTIMLNINMFKKCTKNIYPKIHVKKTIRNSWNSLNS